MIDFEEDLRRRLHTVGVWTGKEAIVIVSDHLGYGPLRAAAYNPSTNRWRSIAEPPVDDRIPSAAGSATWTGTQVILTGVGEDPSSTKVSKVALLDPVSGSWRAGAPAPSGQFPGAVFSQAIWTGSELVGFGLIPRKSPADRVEPVIYAYSPSTDRWRSLGWGLSETPANPMVVWTGDRLFVGGGIVAVDQTSPEAGLLDVSSGKWESLPPAPVGFTGNRRYAEMWTGQQVLTLHSGVNDRGGPLAFDPATRRWSQGPPVAKEATEVPWIWSGGRAVVPLGGRPQRDAVMGTSSCCFAGPAGGEVYIPAGS